MLPPPDATIREKDLEMEALYENTRLRRLPKLRGQLRVLLPCLIRFGCAFLFTGASVRGQYLPAGLCLLTVPGPGLHGLSALLGVCFGAAALWELTAAAALIAAAILIRAAVWIFRDSVPTASPVFLPAAAALSYALAAGVLLSANGGGRPSYALYVFRILLCFGGSLLLRQVQAHPTRGSVLLMMALLILSAGSIRPFGLSCGVILAVFLTACGAKQENGIIAAAVCGITLDLCCGCAAPMAAILCLSVLLASPADARARALGSAVFAMVASVCVLISGTGQEILAALIGIVAAIPVSGISFAFPEPAAKRPSRSSLQMQQASRLLRQLSDTLREDLPSLPEPEPPLIFDRAAERICRTCPQFSTCWDGSGGAYDALSGAVKPMLARGAVLREDFPSAFLARCRRIDSLLKAINQELDAILFRRQYRHRLEESRSLLAGQFGITASYLQAAAESFSASSRHRPICVPVLGMATAERRGSFICGDRGAAFRTARHLHYTLLCDGMGSGFAAMEESAACIRLLQGLLTAGFPPEDALQLLNSTYLLRDDGAFSTVDLLQTDLSTGKLLLWKWGSAPTYLRRGDVLKKIGTAQPPPGLEGTGRAERFELSLDAGDLLVLLSDGADGAGTEEQIRAFRGRSPRELAARIIDQSIGEDDDRTAVVLKLQPIALQRQHTTDCA